MTKPPKRCFGVFLDTPGFGGTAAKALGTAPRAGLLLVMSSAGGEEADVACVALEEAGYRCAVVEGGWAEWCEAQVEHCLLLSP